MQERFKVLLTRKNTENDFRVKFETNRETDNYTVEIVCSTILELIELEEGIKPLLEFSDDIFVEILYKKVNKLSIEYKDYRAVNQEVMRNRLIILKNTPAA